MEYQGFQTREGLTEFYFLPAALFGMMVSTRQIAMSWAGTKSTHLKLKPKLFKTYRVSSYFTSYFKIDATLGRLRCGPFLEHVGVLSHPLTTNKLSLPTCTYFSLSRL